MLARVARGLLRHYRLNTPRDALLRRLPNVPSGLGDLRLQDNLKLACYDSGSCDYVVKSLFWLGSFDPWVSRTLAKLAQPGSTALDIGANIGYMSMCLARAVGHGGRVFCFEPSPESVRKLRGNLEANALRNVQVNGFALSHSSGEMTLTVPRGQPGMARLSEVVDGEAQFRVKTVRFDDWRKQHDVGPISVCKIDVEGHEQSVLTGMEETLGQGLIESLVFENHSHETDGPLLVYLRTIGFIVRRIHKGFHSVHYALPNENVSASPTADYVAVQPGSASARSLNIKA